MNAERLFITGLVFTAGFVTVLLLWLRNPLLATLTELFGSEERARLWARSSLIVLFLVPFAQALGEYPSANALTPTLYEVSRQIASAIFGFSVSLAVLGWLLTRVGRQQKVEEKAER